MITGGSRHDLDTGVALDQGEGAGAWSRSTSPAVFVRAVT